MLRFGGSLLRLAGMRRSLFKAASSRKTILELSPGLNSLADLCLGVMRNIVASGFSVFSAVTYI